MPAVWMFGFGRNPSVRNGIDVEVYVANGAVYLKVQDDPSLDSPHSLTAIPLDVMAELLRRAGCTSERALGVCADVTDECVEFFIEACTDCGEPIVVLDAKHAREPPWYHDGCAGYPYCVCPIPHKGACR